MFEGPPLRLGCPSFEKSMRPQTQYDASSTECAISRRTHQQPIAAIPPSGASAVGTAPSAAPRGGAPCLLVRADASGGQKKISSISNYFVAVSASDGFMDVTGGLTCVAECGEKHVVVSKQAVRQKEVPLVELTKDEATDFCSRASLSRLPSAA